MAAIRASSSADRSRAKTFAMDPDTLNAGPIVRSSFVAGAIANRRSTLPTLSGQRKGASDMDRLGRVDCWPYRMEAFATSDRITSERDGASG